MKITKMKIVICVSVIFIVIGALLFLFSLSIPDYFTDRVRFSNICDSLQYIESKKENNECRGEIDKLYTNKDDFENFGIGLLFTGATILVLGYINNKKKIPTKKILLLVLLNLFCATQIIGIFLSYVILKFRQNVCWYGDMSEGIMPVLVFLYLMILLSIINFVEILMAIIKNTTVKKLFEISLYFIFCLYLIYIFIIIILGYFVSVPFAIVTLYIIYLLKISNGDDPRDQEQIKAGFRWYQQNYGEKEK